MQGPAGMLQCFQETGRARARQPGSGKMLQKGRAGGVAERMEQHHGLNYVLGRGWGQFCRSLEQHPLPSCPALDLAALQAKLTCGTSLLTVSPTGKRAHMGEPTNKP